MDVHQNARTTPHSRMLIVERLGEGWTMSAVAQAMGVNPKTVRKWRGHFAAEGAAGSQDRSSRPYCSPARLDAAAEAEIERLRRERLSGPRSANGPMQSSAQRIQALASWTTPTSTADPTQPSKDNLLGSDT